MKSEEHKISVGKQTLTLTNLSKVYWPAQKYTKADMIEYYISVAKVMLPYLKNRPLMLRRFPNGIDGEGFYQKNVDNFPSWIKTKTIVQEKREIHYVLVQNEETLIYVANLGCIEFHPFSAHANDINYPDYIVIDLDPVEIDFKYVVETAQVLHETLDELGVKSLCKTSGKRGLHIYIPLAAKYDYQQAKQFGELIAVLVNRKIPKITSLERSPSKRRNRVYLDYLQNNKGQTVICPYSLRATSDATVATPLDWSEVKKGLDPTEFTIETVPDRIQEMGDLFKPILGRGVNINSVLKKIEAEHFS